jgi:lysine decarboxylase
MNVKGGLVDIGTLSACIDLLQTTSPSVAVLASIDGWRRQMALDGAGIMARTLKLSYQARERLAEIDGLTIMGSEVLGRPGAFALDPTKIVIDLADLPITGFTAWDRLDNEHHILVELEDHRRLVPLITSADNEQTIDQLVNAMNQLVDWARHQPPQPIHLPPSSDLITETVMSPRTAFFAPAEDIPLRAAAGRIAAEMASPYPPGVPAVCPGERIHERIIEYLSEVANLGALIPDARDPSMKTIRVVKESAA